MLYFDRISKQLQTFLLWNTKPEIERMKQDLRGRLPVPLMTISQGDKRSLPMHELAQNLIPDNFSVKIKLLKMEPDFLH